MSTENTIHPVYLEELHSSMFEENNKEPDSIKDMIEDLIINNAPSTHKIE